MIAVGAIIKAFIYYIISKKGTSFYNKIFKPNLEPHPLNSTMFAGNKPFFYRSMFTG
jgi:hypothetical protein